jgi:DNA-binding NtrC family response regulator
VHSQPDIMSVRVLVADDDAEMRRMLAVLLKRHGFDVESAADGNQVEQKLENMDEKEVPDLIITDVRMPGPSGLHILDRVRRRFPETQVIIITAFGDPRLHARAEQLGAAAVFDKPFDFNELLETVHEVLAA